MKKIQKLDDVLLVSMGKKQNNDKNIRQGSKWGGVYLPDEHVSKDCKVTVLTVLHCRPERKKEPLANWSQWILWMQ